MSAVLRALYVLFIVQLTVGCVTTIQISPDTAILEQEIARLSPPSPVPYGVSIEIKAPEIAAGRKPGRVGEPRNLLLDYPAHRLLNDTAQVCAKRWFSKAATTAKRHELSIELTNVFYDEYTDVFAWRSVISVDLNFQATHDHKKYFSKNYSSGIIKGDWKRLTTERQEQYTRLIYRALLIAVDKAMADLSKHFAEQEAKK